MNGLLHLGHAFSLSKVGGGGAQSSNTEQGGEAAAGLKPHNLPRPQAVAPRTIHTLAPVCLCVRIITSRSGSIAGLCIRQCLRRGVVVRACTCAPVPHLCHLLAGAGEGLGWDCPPRVAAAQLPAGLTTARGC